MTFILSVVNTSMNSPFKFHELSTIYGLLETQIEMIENLVKETFDDEQKKFLKNESSKFKSLKTKLNKMMKDY